MSSPLLAALNWTDHFYFSFLWLATGCTAHPGSVVNLRSTGWLPLLLAAGSTGALSKNCMYKQVLHKFYRSKCDLGPGQSGNSPPYTKLSPQLLATLAIAYLDRTSTLHWLGGGDVVLLLRGPHTARDMSACICQAGRLQFGTCCRFLGTSNLTTILRPYCHSLVAVARYHLQLPTISRSATCQSQYLSLPNMPRAAMPQYPSTLKVDWGHS